MDEIVRKLVLYKLDSMVEELDRNAKRVEELERESQELRNQLKEQNKLQNTAERKKNIIWCSMTEEE